MAKHPHILTERDEQMLSALYLYRYLRLTQITRLFFSSASKNYAGQYLKRLSEAKMLLRFPLPATHKGNREYVYTLAYPGMKYLASLGYDLPCRFSPAEPPPSYQHLQHALEVNDVLIAGTRLPLVTEGIELRFLKTEWMLKHAPLRVSLPSTHRSQETRAATLSPDGLLDFRLHLAGKTYQTAIWLELDRGTEEQRQFRRKVQAIHTALTSKVCQEQWGVQSLSVALATTAGDKRQRALRFWVEQELTSLQKPGDADLFLIAQLPSGELHPERLFLSPIWATPFTPTLVPLLDRS